MTKQTKLKIKVSILVTCILICVLCLIILLCNKGLTLDLIYRWGLLALFALMTISMFLGTILTDIEEIGYEKQVKKILKQDYTKIKISDTDNIPLCIKLALEENNITFYGKYVITKKGDTIVHVVAKKDDQFFTEEILTEKGPMFLTCNEFLNTFEV